MDGAPSPSYGYLKHAMSGVAGTGPCYVVTHDGVTQINFVRGSDSYVLLCIPQNNAEKQIDVQWVYFTDAGRTCSGTARLSRID